MVYYICGAFLRFWTQKKIAAAMRCNLPISHIVRLILCFFDFRYLPCCCGYNPYAFIAHTVQQRVKLPPPGGFLRIAVREEKLIYRNKIPGYKVIEYLLTRLLSLVLDIRKVARGNIYLVAYLFAALAVFISRGFYSCPESLKVVQWYGSFCHFHSPCYILQFTFLFGYVHTIHIIRLNTSCCVLTVD